MSRKTWKHDGQIQIYPTYRGNSWTVRAFFFRDPHNQERDYTKGWFVEKLWTKLTWHGVPDAVQKAQRWLDQELEKL